MTPEVPMTALALLRRARRILARLAAEESTPGTPDAWLAGLRLGG
ncbi:hypothetical protein [Streptomyces sp. NPDC050548]